MTWRLRAKMGDSSYNSATAVAAELRRLIRSGDPDTSGRLPSGRILSNRLGAARGTVSRALDQLAEEGVIVRSGGKAFAAENFPAGHPSFRSARPLELIDARFALEPHICRLAVMNARDADLDDLDRIVLLLEQSNGQDGSFSDHDTDFHAHLAAMTGNALLIWISAQINSVRSLPEWTRMRDLTLEPGIIRQYNDQHRSIAAAIRARQPDDAANLMKAHLETARLSLTRASST